MFHSFLYQVVVTVAETALITALVTFLVMQGVKEFLTLFGVDLSGVAAGLITAIVAVIVAGLNGILFQIPAGWVPLAEELQRLLDLLLGVLGPFGLFRIYRGIKTGK